MSANVSSYMAGELLERKMKLLNVREGGIFASQLFALRKQHNLGRPTTDPLRKVILDHDY